VDYEETGFGGCELLICSYFKADFEVSYPIKVEILFDYMRSCAIFDHLI